MKIMEIKLILKVLRSYCSVVFIEKHIANLCCVKIKLVQLLNKLIVLFIFNTTNRPQGEGFALMWLRIYVSLCVRKVIVYVYLLFLWFFRLINCLKRCLVYLSVCLAVPYVNLLQYFNARIYAQRSNILHNNKTT